MTLFICTNCGEGSSSWMGRCPNCNQWDTLKESRGIEEKKSGRSAKTENLSTIDFSQIKSIDKTRLKTGIYEIDRVLGGGLVKGSVVLLAGEPGIGKSTLLLQSLKNLDTIYISGEESAGQVKDRSIRLGLKLHKVRFSDTLQVEGITNGVDKLDVLPDAIVIDSIQTIYSKNIDSPPGNISQLRECTAGLIRLAKEKGIAIVIVGHVTKDGDLAGPKTLEHMVDAVLHFEGEKISNYRVLRSIKNRFGSTDEIGIFEMKSSGLQEVDNPLAFIEGEDRSIVPGKAIVGVLEGKRPIFYEIQALATPTFLSMPRRVVKGVDYNKFLLILAVIQKNLNLPLGKFDIYINVVGGVDVKSPAADLGIAASVISSVKNTMMKSSAVFCGELGLLGEIRKVNGQEKIIKEAKRLNFTSIYSTENVKNIYQLAKYLKQ